MTKFEFTNQSRMTNGEMTKRGIRFVILINLSFGPDENAVEPQRARRRACRSQAARKQRRVSVVSVVHLRALLHSRSFRTVDRIQRAHEGTRRDTKGNTKKAIRSFSFVFLLRVPSWANHFGSCRVRMTSHFSISQTSISRRFCAAGEMRLNHREHRDAPDVLRRLGRKCASLWSLWFI